MCDCRFLIFFSCTSLFLSERCLLGMQPPIKSLLERFLSNEATPQEIEEILAWLRNNESNEALLQEVWEEKRPVLEAKGPAIPPADWQRIWMQVDAATRPLAEPVRRTYAIRRLWPAVAAALILVTAGLFLLIQRQGATGSGGVSVITGVADVAPGRDGAILTLTDGSRVSLDSAGKGLPAMQGGTKISLQGNRLAYSAATDGAGEGNATDATGKGNATDGAGGGKTTEGAGKGNTADAKDGNGEKGTSPMALTYNTVTTPRGRQFSLVLPDGSRVWLNAASSIKFPTAFAGKERRVELMGEAYFEIAKDKSRPFFVHTDNTETEVLGTSFNISAYNDEGVVGATLIEGGIRTGSQTERVKLMPGEQARMVKLMPGEQTKMGVRVEVDHHANVEQVIAWKNGAFNFGNMGLKEVMRQLARWYDLDVVYEPGVKDFRFGGEMSRNVPLSSLLKGLKDMEVHFRIENDHKLVVMP